MVCDIDRLSYVLFEFDSFVCLTIIVVLLVNKEDKRQKLFLMKCHPLYYFGIFSCLIFLFPFKTLREELSLNQTMLQSAENTIKELMETGKPERHEKLVAQLKGIKAKWAEVTKLFEEVKLRPLKDLEVKFVSLHGNILSEMDNIFRNVKKLKLESPAVVDIQSSLSDLEVRSSPIMQEMV